MNVGTNQRSGGRLLIDQLVVQGVDTAFCVPGESYLAALDAFHDVQDKIQLITCRHEAGAANMAEAYGKLTGKPGVCFVTRGPGACHAVVGLHTAFQDSSPLVLFVGQVAREMKGREAFQEMDYTHFFREASKWAAEIDSADRIPEMVARAFATATSGRPGPVVLSLPEDMLVETSIAGDASRSHSTQAAPSPAAMAELRALLSAAQKPVLLLGGGTWTAEATADIAAFAEANQLPVSCVFRNQDRIDNDHPNYIGELGIGANETVLNSFRDADLVIAVGPRLGEMASQGYTLFGIPRPTQKLVHVHPSVEELGRVYQPVLSINAGMAHFAAAAKAMDPVTSPVWSGAAEEGHQALTAYQQVPEPSGALDMNHVMKVLQEKLPRDTLIANDAGNFAGWPHRYLRFHTYPSQVGPTNGAMGYGVPAGISASLVFPERLVITFVGDGGFLMSGQEIATALHHNLKSIILVVNNGMYGTIRMHQEREFPCRNPGTALTNPDFASYAEAFGAFGQLVTRNEHFAAAFDEALAADRIAVLELRTDPETITTKTTLSKIREAALARKS